MAPPACESSPCTHGGVCVEKDYVCQCPETYMGDICDTPVPGKIKFDECKCL